MHCIDCGTQNLDTTRYCARCGANLEVLRQALTSNLSSGPHTMIGPKHVGFILFMAGFVGLGGLAVVFIGLSILANILSPQLGGALLPLLLFLGLFGVGGVVFVVSSLLKMLRLSQQQPKQSTAPLIDQVMMSARLQSPPMPQQALPRPQYREGFQSVVENTTANLPKYAPPVPEDPHRS